MKIVFLNLYSGEIERGAETQAHQLAQQLQKLYKVEFIKGNSQAVSEHGFSGNLIKRWLNRKRFFVDKAGIEILKFSLKNLNFLLKLKPDWVIPMNGFWQVLLLKLFAPIGKWKILIVGHSGPGWDERWNLYLRPNIFIASTKPMLEWAKKTSPSTTVKLVPYGIDHKKFLVDLKRIPKDLEFINHLQKPIILCPSALVHYKQIDLAIKAVSLLETGSLLVMGIGPLESKLNQLGKEILGDKRFRLSSVPYNLMPFVYQQVDLVTLPSSPQENSPMVFVESLAAGKIVVATKAPRVIWALGDSGVYINPRNEDEYKKGLIKALTKKNMTKVDLEKFKWENVIKKYQEIFESY